MAGSNNGKDGSPGFFRTMKTIGWAFFGVRARSGHEQDVARLKPLHVIAAGVFGLFVFVMVLILVIASVT